MLNSGLSVARRLLSKQAAVVRHDRATARSVFASGGQNAFIGAGEAADLRGRDCGVLLGDQPHRGSRGGALRYVACVSETGRLVRNDSRYEMPARPSMDSVR